MSEPVTPARNGVNPIRALYDWTFRLAGSRRAPHALVGVSFIESFIFPIPPDVMLAPMVLARPDRAYFYAFICTAASVLGGALGYAIGFFLEPLAMSILQLLGYGHKLEQFQALYDEWGLWAVMLGGFTPLPYKLVTIASGLASYSFALFMLGSAATRGARFFLVAFILKRWGAPVLAVVERRLTLVTFLVVGLAIAGVAAVRLWPAG